MKNLIFIVIFYFNFILGYSQDSINQSLDVISTPVLTKTKPIDYDIFDWKVSIEKDIKEKWNLSFTKVFLRFVVEEDGSISNLIVNSNEWNPTDKDVSELLMMINSKGKWTLETTNNQNLISRYSILLTF